jgi:hypothetical protein
MGRPLWSEDWSVALTSAVAFTANEIYRSFCFTSFTVFVMTNVLSSSDSTQWLLHSYLPSNGSTCYIASLLRQFIPNSLQAYRHFFFSEGSPFETFCFVSVRPDPSTLPVSSSKTQTVLQPNDRAQDPALPIRSCHLAPLPLIPLLHSGPFRHLFSTVGPLWLDPYAARPHSYGLADFFLAFPPAFLCRPATWSSRLFLTGPNLFFKDLKLLSVGFWDIITPWL